MSQLLCSVALPAKCAAVLHDSLEHSLYSKRLKIFHYLMTHSVIKKWGPYFSYINGGSIFLKGQCNMILKFCHFKMSQNVTVNRFESTSTPP